MNNVYQQLELILFLKICKYNNKLSEYNSGILNQVVKDIDH